MNNDSTRPAAKIAAILESQGRTISALSMVAGVPWPTMRRRMFTDEGWKVKELEDIAAALGVRGFEVAPDSLLNLATPGGAK